MNLPADHALTAAELIKMNNPIGAAGEPVIPFIWKQPSTATSQKIQVEDQRLNPDGNPAGARVKRAIYMSLFGNGNAARNQALCALEHAYGFYQQVRNMQFLNSKKRNELFGNSLIGTAATRWESVITHHVEVPGYQDTLAYFKTCLQEWVKTYFGKGSRRKHFAFMRSKGSLVKFEKLKVDELAFWEAIFLYNELGDFLWPDPAEPVTKLTENELKRCFYDGQPQKWRQQFEESPNAPKPEDMTVEELKEHFKTKEDNHAKMQLQRAEQQRVEGLKKRKPADQVNSGGGKRGGKSGWKKKKKNANDGNGDKQKKPPATLSKDISCPVHGNHTWGECAANPENKDNKELDKFRPKKQKKNADKKETHNVEFEEPLQDVNNTEVDHDVNMTDASDDDAIGKPINAFESTDSFQATNSHLHHFDCLHLQEMDQCAQSVESTASHSPWSNSCLRTQTTARPLKPILKHPHARLSSSSGIASTSNSLISTPNLAMPVDLA